MLLFVMLKGAVPVTLDQTVAFGTLEVFAYHLADHFLERDPGFPAELGLGIAGVAQQRLDFSGAEVTWVHLHNAVAILVIAFLVNAFTLPRHVDVELGGGSFHKLAY